jgi:Bacterial regulatory protein, arsR family
MTSLTLFRASARSVGHVLIPVPRRQSECFRPAPGEMDSAQRDPREMTDDELTGWMRDLVTRLADETGSASGVCSLEAIKNSVRRNILDALQERALTINEISEKVGVAGAALKLHLNFLENSCFIRVKAHKVDLTPAGVSVVRSHKRT